MIDQKTPKLKSPLTLAFLFHIFASYKQTLSRSKLRINPNPTTMEINTNLAQSTIEAIEKLALIEAQERAILENSESVELNNGEFLNKKEQLAFFEQIYKLATSKGACSQVGKFKSFYETECFYGAWSILLGNFNWLSDRNILSKEKMPKSVSIGTTYHENGQIRAERKKAGFELNGEYVIYYSSGNVCETCSYKDDKQDGEFASYYASGQIWEICQYKKGKIDGEYVKYHRNGHVWVKCSYKDGKRSGERVRYYSNGQISDMVLYDDGKIVN